MAANNINITKRLLNLSREEKINFLNSFDLILCDCDGVISNITEAIPDADRGVNLLKESGKQFKIVTNNSLTSEEEFLKHLQHIGIKNMTKYDTIYPRKLMIQFIKENIGQGLCFSLANTAFNRDLINNGINIKTMSSCNDVRSLKDLNALLENIEPVSAVILDFNLHLTYIELAIAEHYLRTLQCPFLIGVPDSHIKISKDIKIFANLLDIFIKNSIKKPLIFGKPSTILGEYVLKQFHIEQPQRVLFIGDNLHTDIEFGRRLHFQTLFVLTGGHTLEDMYNLEPLYQPDYYTDGIKDFIEFFKEISNQI